MHFLCEKRLLFLSLSQCKNPKHPLFMSLTISAFPSPSQLRITGGRDLWRSPGPTSCSRGAISTRLPRTVSRQLLRISEDADFTTELGNLCQHSSHPHSKKAFSVFKFEPIASEQSSNSLLWVIIPPYPLQCLLLLHFSA